MFDSPVPAVVSLKSKGRGSERTIQVYGFQFVSIIDKLLCFMCLLNIMMS